jgi:Ca2+-binding RTX toxin-like protein
MPSQREKYSIPSIGRHMFEHVRVQRKGLAVLPQQRKTAEVSSSENSGRHIDVKKVLEPTKIKTVSSLLEDVGNLDRQKEQAATKESTQIEVRREISLFNEWALIKEAIIKVNKSMTGRKACNLPELQPYRLSPPLPQQCTEGPAIALGKSDSREKNIELELEQYFVGRQLMLTNSSGVRYKDSKAFTGEILPYGVRAGWGGTDLSQLGNIGTGCYAFVIDSGVLDTTGDIILNRSWSKSWVAGENPFQDGNGHGTHVGATIGALANGKGIVGVAAGAEVISLKIFNSSGGGASYATAIDAINYAVKIITTNKLDRTKCVINMSLGGNYSLELDQAIKNAANQGIRLSLAAGNSGRDVDLFSPASAGDHPLVYTVSAADNSYRMASFSNWDDPWLGDDIDCAAAGVDVYSYYKNGQLAYLSGTSMAAPHVAGMLLTGGIKLGDLTSTSKNRYSDPFSVTALRGINFNGSFDASSLTLAGGNSDDYLYGRSGNDQLTGGLGNDVLNGGLGSDTAFYGSGNNKINLSLSGYQNTNEGWDQLISLENINGGDGDDEIIGNDLPNILSGDAGNDRINGAGGNDSLMGGAGDDWLIGGGGEDRVIGGIGRDTFEVMKGPGHVFITDFTKGVDRIFLGSGAAGLTTTIQNSESFLYQQGDLLAIVNGVSAAWSASGSYLI